MATQLSICNSALMRLGAEPITALTDNTKRAKLCNAHYTTIKQKLLYEHPWKFAIKRESLTAETDIPVFGFDHQFSLPFDYLRAIFEVNGEHTDEMPHEWQREGEFILANDDTIFLRYIADVDEELFSPSFAEALSFHLAYELSYSMVQSASYREQLLQEGRLAIQAARSHSAQEGTPQRITDDEFINIRRV